MTRRESLVAGLAAVTAGAVAGRWASTFRAPRPQDAESIGDPVDTILYVSSSGRDENSGLTWDAALQSVTTALERLGTSVGTVVLAPGDSLTVSESIALDVSLHRLVGDRSTLIFTDDTDGTPLIRCTGSAPQPLHQPWAVLEGLELQGPSRRGGQIGISFETPTSPGKAGAAHVEVRNVSIHDFGTGVTIGDNSYCLSFSNCIIGKCGTCVLIPDGIKNAGERIEFLSSTIFDSEVGFDVRSRSAEVFLLGSSLDYCEKLVTVSAGQVHAVSSHIEFDRSRTSAPILVRGETGVFSMIGGKLTGTTKSQTMGVPSIVENHAAVTAGASFAHVWMTNLSTTSGDFSTGDGRTIVAGELTAPTSYRSFTVVGRTSNLLLDGSFTSATLIDDWYSERDEGVLSLIETPSISSISDSRGLAVAASGGGAQRVTVAVPAAPGSIGRCRYHLTATGSSSGKIKVSFSAGRLRVGLIPRALGRVDLGTPQEFNVSALGSGWVIGRSPLPVQRMPAGATHLFLTISTTELSPRGRVFVGDLNVCAT